MIGRQDRDQGLACLSFHSRVGQTDELNKTEVSGSDRAYIGQSRHRCMVACRILHDGHVRERRIVARARGEWAQERIAAGIYQTLVFAVMDGAPCWALTIKNLTIEGKSPQSATRFTPLTRRVPRRTRTPRSRRERSGSPPRPIPPSRPFRSAM
jgi:hypothetical protein